MALMKQQHGTRIDTIFVFLVFAAFAGVLLITLLMGANIYKQVAEKSKTFDDSTVCMRYIAAKLQHNDVSDAVSVSEFGDGTSLVFSQIIDGSPYNTSIYLYNGYVRELFCEADSGIEPSEGSALIAGKALSVSENNGMILIEFTDSGGHVSELKYALRAHGDIPL